MTDVGQNAYLGNATTTLRLVEQRRIARIVETQFSRLDAAVAGLKRVEANLKRYRASVLKAAVEGRLVPTEAELAKAEGRTLEPASDLLARILKERRARWEAAELASMKAKGRPPKDDAWKAKYKEPPAPDTKALPELPEGWSWATLDQLAWASSYGTSVKCDYNATGIRVLRIPNIASGRLVLEDVKYATKALDESPGSELLPGDFLIVRTNGSRGLIGRAAPILEALPSPTSFASYLPNSISFVGSQRIAPLGALVLGLSAGTSNAREHGCDFSWSIQLEPDSSRQISHPHSSAGRSSESTGHHRGCIVDW